MPGEHLRFERSNEISSDESEVLQELEGKSSTEEKSDQERGVRRRRLSVGFKTNRTPRRRTRANSWSNLNRRRNIKEN